MLGHYGMCSIYWCHDLYLEYRDCNGEKIRHINYLVDHCATEGGEWQKLNSLSSLRMFYNLQEDNLSVASSCL